MDLIEFLNARLDEDVYWARSAIIEHGDSWRTENYDREHDPKRDAAQVVGSRDEPRWRLVAECWRYSATHIARWDPARVLAEVAAKRARVKMLADLAAACPANDWPENGAMHRAVTADLARHLLVMEAQPYASHPDFNPAWLLAPA